MIQDCPNRHSAGLGPIDPSPRFARGRKEEEILAGEKQKRKSKRSRERRSGKRPR
jgi:hypothetical protein